MESEEPIRIFFFPYLARGHIIPMVDAARLFAERGAVCTVVTTAANESYIRGTIDQAQSSGLSLRLHLLPFPSADVGLPAGVECTDTLPSGSNSRDILRLFDGIKRLYPPFHHILADRRPDCVVCDPMLFFCWPPELAASSLSIPHFHFCTTSPFANAVSQNLFLTRAHHLAAGAAVPLEGLPHPLVLDRAEIPVYLRTPNEGMARTREAERWCRGVLFNSFYELAPEYVDHIGSVTLAGAPMKISCVGPVPLYKSAAAAAAGGGGWEWIKKWLDAKDPESVFYVSFGSECAMRAEQLREIAAGLEGCRHSFIWVVRGKGGGAETIDDWLPEDFRARVSGRGLILTEWAPQVAILNHPATGGYVLHCGWNSTVEAVCAGLPVIAWPMHWEQFLHERLVVEVLKIGARILEGPGMRAVDAEEKAVVGGETVRAAVDRLMGGGDEEAREMRRNARRYKELAASAMAEGGSSYVSISRVIEEIKGLVNERKVRRNGEMTTV